MVLRTENVGSSKSQTPPST